MVVVTVAAPDGSSVVLQQGDRVTFGRGGEAIVDLVIDDSGVSELAGWVECTSRGALVVCEQRQAHGFIEVVLPSGQAIARLTAGNSYSWSDPQVRLRLRSGTDQSHQFLVAVNATGAISPKGQGSRSKEITAGSWNRDQVLHPTQSEQWRTVVALASARAVYAPRASSNGQPRWDGTIPRFDWLRRECRCYFRQPDLSTRWLSTRLDEALLALGLDHGGRDKLATILPVVIGGRLIPDDVLEELARQM